MFWRKKKKDKQDKAQPAEEDKALEADEAPLPEKQAAASEEAARAPEPEEVHEEAPENTREDITEETTVEKTPVQTSVPASEPVSAPDMSEQTAVGTASINILKDDETLGETEPVSVPMAEEKDEEKDDDAEDDVENEVDDHVADDAPQAEADTPKVEDTPQAEKTEDVSQEDVHQDDAPQEEKKGWLKRLGGGLSKSTTKITQGISDLVTKRKLDQDLLDELEDVLIMADLGPKTASKLVEEFGKNRFGKEISDEEIKEAFAAQIEAILAPVAQPFGMEAPEGGGTRVVLVSGVNGVGKTTTIGKMANRYQTENGKKVMMAAGDTFRAAAVEQLKVWAGRVGCDITAKDIGADAAAVAYEALETAQNNNVDLLFIDTAGRLHNKSNLMAELEKIVRVLKKKDESCPHDVLLVLDATTGQNAFEQVRIFSEMVNVTGLVITKLDGSAKGGVVVGLADQFGLPIHLIGVGETIDDLQPFKARDFARSLMGLSS